MNIRDFLITIMVSLFTGVGIGLAIRDLWSFLVKTVEVIRPKPKVLKTVDFIYFFGNNGWKNK